MERVPQLASFLRFPDAYARWVRFSVKPQRDSHGARSPIGFVFTGSRRPPAMASFFSTSPLPMESRNRNNPSPSSRPSARSNTTSTPAYSASGNRRIQKPTRRPAASSARTLASRSPSCSTDPSFPRAETDSGRDSIPATSGASPARRYTGHRPPAWRPHAGCRDPRTRHADRGGAPCPFRSPARPGPAALHIYMDSLCRRRPSPALPKRTGWPRS